MVQKVYGNPDGILKILFYGNNILFPTVKAAPK